MVTEFIRAGEHRIEVQKTTNGRIYLQGPDPEGKLESFDYDSTEVSEAHNKLDAMITNGIALQKSPATDLIDSIAN